LRALVSSCRLCCGIAQPTRRLFSSFFSLYAAHRNLHSFPTRRSSDLVGKHREHAVADQFQHVAALVVDGVDGGLGVIDAIRDERSEEHTSELQSLRHLVCRLLLEKKNTCPDASSSAQTTEDRRSEHQP